MKWRRLFTMIGLLAPTVLAAGQSGNVQTRAADTAQLTGVWRAQMDGLPAVSLIVTDEGGSLSGAVLFYLHMRKSVNDAYTSTPGLPEPLFALHFDGKTLDFEVSHRRAHPPDSLNEPPMHFHLRLTGPNQAELVNESEHGPAVTMVRSVY
jgi:hypothetical protein